MQWGVIGCFRRFCLRGCKSRRFRVGIGVINRLRAGGASGPKTNAANFLRVSFARDPIGQMWDSTGMRGRLSPRKPGDCKIKTSPEKMHRAAFAAEARAKFFQDAIGL